MTLTATLLFDGQPDIWSMAAPLSQGLRHHVTIFSQDAGLTGDALEFATSAGPVVLGREGNTVTLSVESGAGNLCCVLLCQLLRHHLAKAVLWGPTGETHAPSAFTAPRTGTLPADTTGAWRADPAPLRHTAHRRAPEHRPIVA